MRLRSAFLLGDSQNSPLRRLPAGLPAFMGNLDVGHSGTFDLPDGGEFGRVGGTG